MAKSKKIMILFSIDKEEDKRDCKVECVFSLVIVRAQILLSRKSNTIFMVFYFKNINLFCEINALRNH